MNKYLFFFKQHSNCYINKTNVLVKERKSKNITLTFTKLSQIPKTFPTELSTITLIATIKLRKWPSLRFLPHDHPQDVTARVGSKSDAGNRTQPQSIRIFSPFFSNFFHFCFSLLLSSIQRECETEEWKYKKLVYAENVSEQQWRVRFVFSAVVRDVYSGNPPLESLCFYRNTWGSLRHWEASSDLRESLREAWARKAKNEL